MGSTAFATSFGDIVQAYKVMLLGRTLNCDDGAMIVKFTTARQSSDGRFVASYLISFANGSSSSGVESVQNTTSGVFVDQIAEGITTRHNVASIEEPYHVFRVRPFSPQTTDFITRDCVRKNDAEGSVCYIKVRYMGDVIVTECREPQKLYRTR